MAVIAGNIHISTQTILVVAMIGIVLAVPLYSTMLEQMEEISPTMLMLSPVILLILIRWLSHRNSTRRSFFFSEVDPSSIHRAGGSPVGVAIILSLVLLMIWYQSEEDDSEE